MKVLSSYGVGAKQTSAVCLTSLKDLKYSLFNKRKTEFSPFMLFSLADEQFNLMFKNNKCFMNILFPYLVHGFEIPILVALL